MPSVLAIVCVRNEAVHIERCLSDLINGGCDVHLIDNGSTDGTRELASRFLGAGLLGIDDLEWTGAFSLTAQMEAKNALVARATHDWIVHADADESMVSGREGESLIDAISEADAAGYNVINFHEMAFVPLPGEDFEHPDYASCMSNYYFFQPKYPRLNRAWKRSLVIESGSNGHLLKGEGIERSPRDLFLRHYLVLSEAHAERKYVGRQFGGEDIAKGWHGNRVIIDAENVRLRTGPAMRRLESPTSNEFDLSAPAAQHYWQWAA